MLRTLPALSISVLVERSTEQLLSHLAIGKGRELLGQEFSFRWPRTLMVVLILIQAK